MIEQTPQPDSDRQDALPEPQRPARKTGMADAISRISVTQMTLAVLAVIFLWQWLAGHRAISDMQQQLAKTIAEMDGGSKASLILLTQSQDQVRELSAKVAMLETHYAEAQNQRAALEALYADMSVSRDERSEEHTSELQSPKGL